MKDERVNRGGRKPRLRPPESRFFRNLGCEYFPCHEAPAEEFNCLFCYCPLYHGECPGEPRFTGMNGARVKDCSGCLYPHHAEHYEEIVRLLISMHAGGRGEGSGSGT